MRILIAADTYYPHINGASYFTQRLARALKKRGHKILVIAPSKRINPEYTTKNGIKIFGIRSIYCFAPHNFRVPLPIGLRSEIKSAINKFKPDVIHVQGHVIIPRAVIKIAKEERIPVIGTNHFMPENLVHYLHLPTTFEKKLIKLSWGDLRRVFESLEFITTPTQTAADLLKNIGLKKKIYPVSCGIDLKRFNPNKKSKNVLKKYNLPNVPILLYVGRLDKEKHVDFVIKAISRVSPKVNFHFAIAGEGAEKKKLQKIVKVLNLKDKVTFLGFVPNKDLPHVYASSDCFVIAGTAELQSIVTLEAMASALPILAVNAVALPELAHKNENAFLFDLRSTKDLAKKITKFFSSPPLRKKMGKKSLEIIQKHDINKTISDYENFYKKAIHSSSLSRKT